jgi:hypothetical protein
VAFDSKGHLLSGIGGPASDGVRRNQKFVRTFGDPLPGTKGPAGEWNEAAGSRRLNEPNDLRGHTPGKGDLRVPLTFNTLTTCWPGSSGADTLPQESDVITIYIV